MMVPVLASVVVSSVRQHKEDTTMLLKVVLRLSFYNSKVLKWFVGSSGVHFVHQGFQVVWKLLDTCSSAAAEIQKEGFEKEIFQILRESTADQRRDPVRQGGDLKLSFLS